MANGLERRRRVVLCEFVAMASTVLAACGPDPATVAGGSVTQQKRVLHTDRPSPHVLLFVIDDAPSERARELRSWVADEFASRYEAGLASAVEACTVDDPGVWIPAERHVVVAHSSPDAPSISFATDPALSWVTERRTLAEEQAWVGAVSDALRNAESEEPGEYAPLEVAARWSRLFTGEEAPATPEEQAVVDGLPARTGFDFFVIGTRDDDSPLPVEDYVLELQNSPFGAVRAAVPDAEFESCGLPTAPRFAAWLAGFYSTPPRLDEPCDEHGLFAPTFVIDCFPSCQPRVPVVDEDGRTECAITGYTLPEASCNSEFGWMDPKDSSGVRRPRLGDYEGQSMRVCELPELEGAALEACRTDFQCSGCGSGWCSTDVSEVKMHCNGAGSPWPLRLVGGVENVAGGVLEITCNVE